jgi:hypothetical protein
MAFDQQSGVIVAMLRATETWTFDVTANGWRRATDLPIRPTLDSSFSKLAYDPVSDLTILTGVSESGPEPYALRVWAYDVESDTWESRASPPAGSWVPFRLAADPDTGTIVAWRVSPPRMWSYTVAMDSWAPIDQNGASPDRLGVMLIAYDPSIKGFVAVSGPGWTRHTWMFKRRLGTWHEIDTLTPLLNFAFGDLTTGLEMTFDAASGRVAMFSDGVLVEFDHQAGRWIEVYGEATWSGLSGDTGEGPLNRVGHTIVYDPSNARIVLYGGQARLPEGWATQDDMWAFHPATGQWQVLVEPSTP